ncbi:MAG: Rha family transcriptional regulator [Capnocytophaga sp.]|nr:Rha family transcriptional regulator [Capnocytophaga sp.]
MTNLIHTVEQTMTSNEIAQLTKKRHQHVMRDIRELNESYEKLGLSKIGLIVKNKELHNGHIRKDPYCELTKLQTFDLLTGYSRELRIIVNRRWAELEAKNLLPIPKPLDIHGMEALPYIEWSLQHGYSVTGGNFHRRIRRHAGHFYRTSAGKWYISTEFAKGLLKFREGQRKLSEIKLLPGYEQLEMF